MKSRIVPLAVLMGGLVISGLCSGQESVLEEMVVTATRGERTLATVPAAVSVIEQDDIQLGRQQLGLDESLNRVPGLFTQNRYNFAQDLRVSIRGAGSRATFGIRGIKIYIDGIPATTTDGQGGVDDIDLGSAARVEVIRGPSSSLYGSSSGGIISIFSEDGPETPFVEGRVTVGEYDMQKYQLKAGGQYGGLNYMVNASHLSLQGYREHSLVDHWLVNSKFRYDIDADSDLTVIVNAVDSPVADDPGGVPRSFVDADPRQAWTGNLAFDAGEALDQQRVGLVYRHSFGAAHEIKLTNFYVWRDFIAFLPLLGGGVSAFDRFYFGGGAQYTWKGELIGRPNRFTAGFEADSQEDDRRRYDNLFGAQGPLVLDQIEHGESYGFYFRNELALTDTVELAVGGRYDSVDLAVDDKFLANADQSGDLDFDEFSATVGLVWMVHPDVSLFVNYGTAFETPTFTELGGIASELTEELGGFNNVAAQSAESFEIGARAWLWDRVNVELAAWTMQVDDEVTNIVTLGNRGFFENADTDRQGFEAAAILDVFDGMTLTTSYTYSDMEFDRFPGDPALEGNKVPLIPEQQFYAELAWRHPSGLYAIWDLLWVDEFFADNANTTVNESYYVSNIRVGHSFQFGHVTVSPFLGINNLFGEEYNGNVRPNAFGGRYFEPAPDENLYGGVTVRYRF
ncbi:MAG: TonB-dependent receptor [Gammaproteobacteria bacterium]|nr:TonB-dependent receptor [Gammaproteobacteria bacterium]